MVSGALASSLLLQAVLGTWVFAYGLKRRPHFIRRAVFSLAAGALLAEGATRLLWHFSGWTQLLTISLIYGLLILVGFLCFDESIWSVMFVASSGYMLQDIASSIKQLLRLWPWVNGFMQTNAGLICIDALCYGDAFCWHIECFAMKQTVWKWNSMISSRLHFQWGTADLRLPEKTQPYCAGADPQ